MFVITDCVVAAIWPANGDTKPVYYVFETNEAAIAYLNKVVTPVVGGAVHFDLAAAQDVQVTGHGSLSFRKGDEE